MKRRRRSKLWKIPEVGFALMFNQLTFASFGFIFAIIAISSINTNPSLTFTGMFQQPIYKSNEVLFHNDSAVINITDYCSPFEHEEQVECVIGKVNTHYNYVLRNVSENSSQPLFKTPTEFFEEGGLCRDVALTYGAIFRNLGWKTNYIFTSDHVYNKISTKYFDCYINAGAFNCFQLLSVKRS